MGRYDNVSVADYDVSGKVDSGSKTEYSDNSSSVFSNMVSIGQSAISAATGDSGPAYESPFGLKDPDEYNAGSSGSNGNWSSSHHYPSEMYGYGSKAGSGNYSPRIYSNARSINADRPSTMYSKQPYNANRTYLNPSFSTKGSREAYKRQDI